MSKPVMDNLERVFEAYRSGKVSRRAFLKYLGIAGASTTPPSTNATWA